MLKPKFNVSKPININSLQYPPTSGGANTSHTHEKKRPGERVPEIAYNILRPVVALIPRIHVKKHISMEKRGLRREFRLQGPEERVPV